MASANYDLNLKEGWRFHLGDVKRLNNIPIGISHVCCKAGGAIRELDMFTDESAWKDVVIPHDWLTDQPLDQNADAAGGFKNRGTGWYYLKFKLPDTPIEKARLVFEGVLGNSTVYVNGVTAGRNFSGYNRFSCNIEDYLLPGDENEIALYVDARRFEGWWYEGAGLYRPVHIEFRENARFESEKCFIRGEKAEEDWNVVAELNISGIDAEKDNLIVNISLQNSQKNVVACKEFPARSNTNFSLGIPDAKLWTPESPYLYTAVFELKREGRVIDRMQNSVGLRTIEWKADKGMYLNGEQYRVKGICCHQDHAGVGAAVTKEIMEFRISKLKQFGINAYRVAHHAPAEVLLDICDRQGMLVMVENRHFAVSEDVFKQVDALVCLCRNHPSVFLYSLFNEEPWQSEERGRRMAEKMRSRILSLDPTRAITGAQNGGMLEKKNASDALDVIGVNYFLADYDATHNRAPQKVMIGTENCPTYATRGVYRSDKDKQVFANYGEEWGDFSESLEETMETVTQKSYVAGCFAWCGFDHRGEPTPYGWPSVVSHWGFHDDCGFAKDTAYLLAAWYREELCVHLLPHWNWELGEQVRVCAYTNADTAELFLNGRSLGEKNVHKKRVEWKVPFEAGTLSVCAKKEGKEVYDTVRTAGTPYYLTLDDAVCEMADKELHIINVSVTDKYGIILPDFAGMVYFDAPEGTILGIGNGDPNSHHEQKASAIALFHGRAQIIVHAGKGKLTAHCDGLPDTQLNL